MSAATWKPARASAWEGLCCAACGAAQMADVALVDSGASHCFVSETVVAKFELPVFLGDGIEMTLADGSQVEVYTTCLLPLVMCSAHL